MSEIKHIEPMTGWISLHLAAPAVIDPPLLRVRLRPLTAIDLMDSYSERLSQITLGSALAAIAEWDLTDGGKPLPCTDEAKRVHLDFLRVLLSTRVERRIGPSGSEEAPAVASPRFVATEIQIIAREPESFLKN